MKDITAILIHYSDQAVLTKALISLKKLQVRLKSIIILQDKGMSLHRIHDSSFDQIDYHTIEANDLGVTLNDIIAELSTAYVLFLQDTDYISPSIRVNSFQIPQTKAVLGTIYQNRDVAIHLPLLVYTPIIKKIKFLTNLQLPFKEALLPAWLSNVEKSQQLMKDGLVKQAKKNSSSNTIERLKFIQKYSLTKNKIANPTVSVLIANYNMGNYVETAIVSCLLQSVQFEQILIIDDGSTDNSYQQIQQWDNGKQVKVFHKKNEGKAKALNELLSHVTSDFILELDADDWLDPDAASIIKNHLVNLPSGISVVYGNLRKWKQLAEGILYKGVKHGRPVNGKADLLAYHFPLGPRIYRTSLLKGVGGFPVIAFENGRLFEDVSMLIHLIKKSRFNYQDFTVYNVREHKESITRNNDSKWSDYLRSLTNN